MNPNNFFPLPRTTDVLEQNLLNEVLIYDLNDNRAFSLNPGLSAVWKMCDGKRNVKEIAKRVSKKLDSNVTEEFVLLALDQLNKEKLLANNDFKLSRMTGLSRRDVVKKAALAGALPVISLLFVPNPVVAQSGCSGSGGPCGSPGPVCCPGLSCNGLTCTPTTPPTNAPTN